MVELSRSRGRLTQGLRFFQKLWSGIGVVVHEIPSSIEQFRAFVELKNFAELRSLGPRLWTSAISAPLR